MVAASLGYDLARSRRPSVRLLTVLALLGLSVGTVLTLGPTAEAPGGLTEAPRRVTTTSTSTSTTSSSAAPEAAPTATASAVAAAPPLLWSAGQDGGTTAEWSAGGGGGLYNSGTYETAASSERRLNSSHSLRARIWTPASPASGVRAVRWKEARANRELYYSTWIYLPQRLDLAASFVNLLQFKSRSQDGSRNDPLWAFYGARDGKGGFYLRAGWGWGGTPIVGPRRTDGVGGKWFEPSRRVSVPVGRWVHLEAFLRQSRGFDGRLRLWQDGVQLFDLNNIRTSFDNCNYNRWCASNEWSVNLYSDGLRINPTTMYVDNSAIARSYIP
jgi:hypothetical protein